ncbi:MAG: NAD(P)/FAD-dependent oxidoreductase [Phycisphaeraceae bacterium]
MKRQNNEHAFFRDNPHDQPTVVVVGAGFAGLAVAKALKRSRCTVMVLDRRNYHLFQPLLYQVATAALSPSDIAQPIRHILRNQRNTEVYMAEVEGIDLDRKRVIFDGGEGHYDYLVVACGARTTYFGNESWREHAPGLKDAQDALEIRQRLLLAFEDAEREADPKRRQDRLTFVVVGGGPTGVELAGAIMEIAAVTIPQDFRNVNTRAARVILVDAGDRLLRALPESLSHSAQEQLERLGVEVHLGHRVREISGGEITIGDNKVPTSNVIWAAGVEANELTGALDIERNRGGQVKVQSDLSIKDHPEVFVIGDAAQVVDDEGASVPGVAPAAIQMGKYVGRLIADEVRSGTRLSPENRKKFIYKDRGMMATIGKAKAVADLKHGIHLKGLLAWLAWSLVHVLVLVGFRSKVFVVIGWVWAYLMNTKGARIIHRSTSIHSARPETQLPDQDRSGQTA